jgi:hypothetical protein
MVRCNVPIATRASPKARHVVTTLMGGTLNMPHPLMVTVVTVLGTVREVVTVRRVCRMCRHSHTDAHRDKHGNSFRVWRGGCVCDHRF